MNGNWAEEADAKIAALTAEVGKHRAVAVEMLRAASERHAAVAALTAERDALKAELVAATQARDDARCVARDITAERDAIQEKWVALMSAIGGHWSTTDLAIKALEGERDERDRFRAIVQRFIDGYEIHEEGCPEDDTCECPFAKEINEVFNKPK